MIGRENLPNRLRVHKDQRKYVGLANLFKRLEDLYPLTTQKKGRKKKTGKKRLSRSGKVGERKKRGRNILK